MTPRPQARPSATLHFFTALSFCTVGYATSAPGGYALPLLIGSSITLLTAGSWLWALVRAHRADKHATRAHWRTWSIGPALLVVLLLRVPLYVRFLASLPAMNEAAEQAWRASREGESEHWTNEPRRVGLYGDCWLSVDLHARSVIVEVPDTGWIERGGFAYVQDDETPRDSPDRYTRMLGRWHEVTLEF